MNDFRQFARSSDLVARIVGDETVLVPVRNNVGDLDSVFTLTPVAAQIWEWIDGRTPVDALVTRLVDEYDVTAEVAARDVAELLETLESARLIQRGDES